MKSQLNDGDFVQDYDKLKKTLDSIYGQAASVRNRIDSFLIRHQDKVSDELKDYLEVLKWESTVLLTLNQLRLNKPSRDLLRQILDLTLSQQKD